MLAGPTPSTFLVLEGGLDDNLSPQSFNSESMHIINDLRYNHTSKHVFLMELILKCRRMFLITYHNLNMTVKVENPC